jgi:hypothetical protein
LGQSTFIIRFLDNFRHRLGVNDFAGVDRISFQGYFSRRFSP